MICGACNRRKTKVLKANGLVAIALARGFFIVQKGEVKWELL
jgi:hypothetical protein